MMVREQATQTKPIRYSNHGHFSIKGENLMKFLSSLILPLMLGIFTVVITFQQQKVARQQRLEDKNESRLQREQDWTIAQLAQAAQNKATSDRYRDEVLVAYIKEIGDLLKDNNGSLTKIPLIHTLARVKTLNTIRQLDGSRQIHVLRFLYEAKQLMHTDESLALDISTAKLIDMDFRTFTPSNKIENLHLTDVYLYNCTFAGMILNRVNFSSTHFSSIDFSSAEFFNINFSSTQFDNVNFALATFQAVNFSLTKFHGADFSFSDFQDVNFSFAFLWNINFSHTESYHVRFNFASFKNVNSSSGIFQNVDFAFVGLQMTNFSYVTFENVNFSSARFMEHLDFSYTMMSDTNFTLAWFFSGLASFYRSKISNIIFKRCHCNEVDFSYADLKNSSFYNATLTNAKFILSNLQNTDLIKTNITDNQLQSALSIRNAILPNETFGQARNLVKNGDAICSISLYEYWKVINGNVVVIPSNTNDSQCQFVLQSTAIGAVMSQEISLVDTYDSSFWTRSIVELQIQMSNGVSIELINKDKDNMILTRFRYLDSYASNLRKPLLNFTKILEVIIRFDKRINQSSNGNHWCDNIELFIDYGT